jgi:hypothetical protein
VLANLQLTISDRTYDDLLSRPIGRGLHAVVVEFVERREVSRSISDLCGAITGGEDLIFAQVLGNMLPRLPKVTVPASEEEVELVKPSKSSDGDARLLLVLHEALWTRLDQAAPEGLVAVITRKRPELYLARRTEKSIYRLWRTLAMKALDGGDRFFFARRDSGWVEFPDLDATVA